MPKQKRQKLYHDLIKAKGTANMPPSHHSSSSHYSSSSHHSSSHHSSSHSSSRSSSSYRSGYSGRTIYSKLAKPRFNQPHGGHSSKTITCINHTYDFYPEDWVDAESGVLYKKGYYDENGVRYDSIAFSHEGEYETKMMCDYCGTEIKLCWREGAAPQCPNCGANMTEELGYVAKDILEVTEPLSQTYKRNKSAVSLLIVLLVFFLSPCLCIVIVTAVSLVISIISGIVQGITGLGSSHESSIYVEEIGRECMWLSDYDSYYDSKTDCYFWYNDEIQPPEWQYWYEDISSDYGDYGWMEFDDTEDCWYIEITNGYWEELPSYYDTSYLWHIED